MSAPPSRPDHPRGFLKLARALDRFGVEVRGQIVADFGSHVGGFVECLLLRGAERVYAVDTAYGILAWKLRRNPRVIVMERTNAIHVALPERPRLITIDVGWTPQRVILPSAACVDPSGQVVTLIKPHYEASPDQLDRGVLADDRLADVVERVLRQVGSMGWEVVGTEESPMRGHGGNREVFALLRPPRLVQGHPPVTVTRD